MDALSRASLCLEETPEGSFQTGERVSAAQLVPWQSFSVSIASKQKGEIENQENTVGLQSARGGSLGLAPFQWGCFGHAV